MRQEIGLPFIVLLFTYMGLLWLMFSYHVPTNAAHSLVNLAEKISVWDHVVTATMSI